LFEIDPDPAMTALLPGLWILALGALLAALLRRYFDPVPRSCWLAWSAALAALFLPVLCGGRSQLPLAYLTEVPPYSAAVGPTAGGNPAQSDLVLHVTPWLVQVRAAWLDGRWPLWNPLAGCGEPLLANPQSQALQPLVLLALPFPSDVGAGVAGALRTLLAFAFAGLLLRRLGFHPATALWGSLAYGLSGFLQSWLGWPLANVAALTPLLLYALLLVEERGRPCDAILLAAATVAVLLGGHPETELHLALFATAFAGSRLLGREGRERWTILRRWAAPIALGAALATPALLPAAELLPRTQRAALLAARQATSSPGENAEVARSDEKLAPAQRSRGPLARLVSALAPNALGNNRYGRYWGDRNIIDDGCAFAGTAALLGLAIAVVPRRQRRGRLPHERLAFATTLLALLVVARPAFLPSLLDTLPVLRQSLGYHARLASLLCFAVTYLAACTWERWRRGEISRAPVLAGTAILGAVLLAAYLSTPTPSGVGRELLQLRWASLAVQLASLALAAALLLRRPEAFDAPSGGRQARIWATAAMTLAIAAEPILFQRTTSPSAPRSLFYPPTATTDFLRRHLDPWHRIAGLGGVLRPSFASVYGLADARSSNPTKLASARDYLRPINRFPDRPTDGFFDPLHPLYARIGVRLLATAPRTRLPPPYRLAFRSPEAWIYRNPEARPLLYLRPEEGAEGSGLGLRLGNAAPARLTARALLAEPRALESSVVQEGNWKLLRNGAPWSTTSGRATPAAPKARAVQADPSPFLAAALPAGDSDLELLYRPETFVAGLGLAALALTAGAALWVRPPQAARRSQTAIQRSA
jgi:hypothetical protein